MSKGKKWRILIIDDDPLVLNSFLSLFIHDGYEATGVSNASSAIETLGKAHFDIVLTELIMEDMGGDELLTSILQRSPDIKVMVITGYASLQMAIQAIQKGAYDYIIKPCNYQDLKIRIERAISAIRVMEEKKKAEKALIESEEKYRILVENIQDLLILCDTEKNCLYANPNWESHLGISLSRLVGKNWLDLLSPEDRNSIERGFNSLQKEKESSQEFKIMLDRTEGKRTFNGYMLCPHKTDDQNPLIFILFQDITAHLRNQEQEKEIEKLNAAKDLAIATAHHINQPMTCIRGLTEVMAARAKAKDSNTGYLNEILDQCDRVQEVIKRLLHINKYDTVPYVDEEMLNLS